MAQLKHAVGVGVAATGRVSVALGVARVVGVTVRAGGTELPSPAQAPKSGVVSSAAQHNAALRVGRLMRMRSPGEGRTRLPNCSVTVGDRSRQGTRGCRSLRPRVGQLTLTRTLGTQLDGAILCVDEDATRRPGMGFFLGQ